MPSPQVGSNVSLRRQRHLAQADHSSSDKSSLIRPVEVTWRTIDQPGAWPASVWVYWWNTRWLLEPIMVAIPPVAEYDFQLAKSSTQVRAVNDQNQ